MRSCEDRIYLDNAATTAVYEEVFDAMRPYFCGVYGNPSSQHAFGRAAAEAVITVPGKENLKSRYGRTENLGKGRYRFKSPAAAADLLE